MTVIGAKGFVFTITGELPPGLDNEAMAQQFVMSSVSVNAVIGPFVRTFHTRIVPLYQLDEKQKQ